MIKEINNEAKMFIEKANQVGDSQLDEEIEILRDKFGDLIPSWYIDLISELPLIHMEVGWQAYEPGDDYDGI